MHSNTKLTVKDATDAKTLQIQHLRDPNPIEDVPDQDSAEKQQNIVCCLTVGSEQSWVMKCQVFSYS